jgi:Leucine-rich repeat (LRR) protein
MRFLYFIFILTSLQPKGFCQVEMLDSVSLAVYQEYTDLDEALKNPDNVVKLTLRKKKYKSFPPEIFKLKNLQYLDLSKNVIKELPDSIVNMTALQYLIVSKTGLERLPVNFGKMKSLRYLNLNQNEIERLPYSFGELENLEYADLWSNNLEYFPESMKDLKKLRKMDLRNILIPAEHQENLQKALPNTKIYFSPPCNCSW